jgi:hypothetical protein
MQQIGFLLQNLLFVQHVSGTIMSIIRSSRVTQVAAACGTWLFGLQVVGYVSGLRDTAVSRKPDSSTPDQRPVNQRTKYYRQQPSV